MESKERRQSNYLKFKAPSNCSFGGGRRYRQRWNKVKDLVGDLRLLTWGKFSLLDISKISSNFNKLGNYFMSSKCFTSVLVLISNVCMASKKIIIGEMIECHLWICSQHLQATFTVLLTQMNKWKAFFIIANGETGCHNIQEDGLSFNYPFLLTTRGLGHIPESCQSYFSHLQHGKSSCFAQEFHGTR